MRKTTLFVLGALMTHPALARDIEYTYEGQTLTYTVISEENKTVSTKAAMFSIAGNNVTGDLVIPSTIVDSENVTYTVTLIGQNAFYNCRSLTSVIIPETVTSIGRGAFACCAGLSELTIPNSVTEIGKYAFETCLGLTSITIPASVISIEAPTFDICNSLSAIIVDDENTKYSSQNGVLFNKDKTSLLCFPAGKKDKNYSIPNSVTTIGEYSFYRCAGLTSVTIPNSVTTIGGYAFFYCTGLTSMNIPNSVTTIKESVFYNCTGLTSLSIGNSVTSISEYAFYNCTGLTSVTIPESVTTIGGCAFSKCSGLKAVYYGAKSPIRGGASIFDVYESATLYVRAEAVEECKQIDPWKNFKSIEEYEFAAGVEVVCDDVDMEAPYEVYSMQGVAVGNAIDGLSGGVYVIRQGNAVKKIAVK